MIGKEVDVMANGMKYSGVLVEVSDTEVHLKTSMQWVSLPASSVSTIALKRRETLATSADEGEG